MVITIALPMLFRYNVFTDLCRKQPSIQIPSVHGHPAPLGLFSHYQTLGVAASNRRTYFTGIKALHQFCAQYATLQYFCCYMAHQVSYNILAGIQLEHLERGFEDPTNDELLHLLCTGIKRSQGVSTLTHLPITINIFQTLSALTLPSHLLWAAFTMEVLASQEPVNLKLYP